MAKLFTHILLSLLLIISNQLSAQNLLQPIQKISMTEGLSQNGAIDVFEASDGYIWIGTYNGLCRYNGYNVDIYKNNVDSNPLPNNIVRTFCEDQKNQLWIGTESGVTVYNTITEEFLKVKDTLNTLSHELLRINDLMYIGNSKVLALSRDGYLLLFNDNRERVRLDSIPSILQDEGFECYNFIEISDDYYAIATTSGLLYYNVNTGEFNETSLKSLGGLRYLLEVDNTTFLAILNNGGLVFVNYNVSGDICNFSLESDIKLKDKNLLNCAIDELNNLWIGYVGEGFIRIDNIFSFRRGEEYKLEEEKRYKVGLIKSIPDRDCWLSTFDKGVLRYKVNNTSFSVINSGSVKAMVPYKEGKLLILNENNRLTLFDINSKSSSDINFGIDSDISYICKDYHNTIWIFTVNNKVYTLAANGILRFKKVAPNLDYSSEEILSSALDNNNNLWLGTNKNLYRLGLSITGDIIEAETIEGNPFLAENNLINVRAIYPDKNSNYIWVGTEQGLLRFRFNNRTDLSKVNIEQFSAEFGDSTAISSNFITSIIRLGSGELWIGTEQGGICKVIESSNNNNISFKSYTEREGLSNDVVKSITRDVNDNIWVATNLGLDIFNTKSLLFHRYNHFEGVQFVDYSYLNVKDNEEIIYLSTLDGFCYFNSVEISMSEELPILNIDEFAVNNREIKPKDKLKGRELFNRRLISGDTIKLRYNENLLSIKLNSLHFSDAETHFIKYKLSPLNDDWVKVPSSKSVIQFTGLQPNRYVLEFMASNSYEEWTEPQTLSLIIKPPFWKTIFAYCFYAITILLLFFIVAKLIIKWHRLNYKLDIHAMEIDKIKDFNSSKLKYLSNLSHELKTPLSLIVAPVLMLAERFTDDKEVHDKLLFIEKQSEKMLKLIEQSHNIQLDASSTIELIDRSFNFSTFISDIVSDFNFKANNEGKRLEVVAKEENDIEVFADKDKVENILNNLLNNAFKYTKANDLVRVTYCVEDVNLIVEVEDTGIGISSDDLPFIFDAYYQAQQVVDAKIDGFGVGLSFVKKLTELYNGSISVTSELGVGSKFTLVLPVVQLVNEEGVEYEPFNANKNIVIEGDSELNLSVNSEYGDSTVFIVDDNIDVLNLLSELFSKHFKVFTFLSGRECLDTMESNWPDLVISDVCMDNIDGYELCSAIKDNLVTSHIPIILLTASTSVDAKVKGIELGADSYIQKPFHPQLLLSRAETLIKSRIILKKRYDIDVPLSNNTDSGNGYSSKDSKFLDTLYALMEQNLSNEEIDINSFAKDLGLNRTHFYSKVKLLTNQTPYELLKLYRLKRAAELLQAGENSIGEICVIVGFKNRAHFGKLFKERYNVVPSKYKK